MISWPNRVQYFFHIGLDLAVMIAHTVQMYGDFNDCIVDVDMPNPMCFGIREMNGVLGCGVGLSNGSVLDDRRLFVVVVVGGGGGGAAAAAAVVVAVAGSFDRDLTARNICNCVPTFSMEHFDKCVAVRSAKSINWMSCSANFVRMYGISFSGGTMD